MTFVLFIFRRIFVHQNEVDRLRRELEAMKNDIRSGRMPVIDTATATLENRAGVGGGDGDGAGGGAQVRRLNKEEEEEEEDVFKRLFSNDRLV